MDTLTRAESAAAPDVARVQRRTLRVLAGTQVLSGVGVAVGASVGALLAARLAGGPGLSGLAAAATVIGSALLAIPVSRLMQASGRRAGLVAAYLTGAAGAVGVVAATALDSFWLALVGMFVFGGGVTANMQSRYTAVDLAAPDRRARQLSLIVWATTVGAVAGPSLASPADAAIRPLGLPALSGAFAFSAVAFVVGAGVLFVLLRPDPLLVARSVGTASQEHAPRRAMRAALREVAGRPVARLGLAAMAVGHAVMNAVMAMTPVHIDGVLGHHGPGAVLRVVGIVLSLHILGMYALSPVVGWAADRLGRRPVVLLGVVFLVAACAFAGLAGHRTPLLAIGLFLLGLGWSCTLVAGSTMLSEGVPAASRPAAQGLGDFAMGVAGAGAGALSGLVVQLGSYSMLSLVAALATVPLVAAALRPPRSARPLRAE